MSLQNEIDVAQGHIRTDGYPMSISELISLYEHAEIDIHPEFQRFYRWSEVQKSMLGENSFTTPQRLLLKRAKLDISIIERESDDKAKYELFQRLNTGGSIATPQEVRNCMLVMLNRGFYQWLRNLANYESFRQCIALSDRLFEEQYDVELALRFVLLFDISKAELTQIKDIGVFLTDQMLEVAGHAEIDFGRYESAFFTTFDTLARTTGSNSFRRYARTESRYTGGFLLSAFEVVALGIGFNHLNLPTDAETIFRIQSIWTNDVYNSWSGSGITAMRRLPHIIPLGRKLFKL